MTSSISVLDAVVAAYQARDQNGPDRANNALQHQAEWLDAVAANIVTSNQRTAAVQDLERAIVATLGRLEERHFGS